MGEPRTLLWDIGGVLLSNGWDEGDRERAAARFGFDAVAFERRHAREVSGFERGEISLTEYLDRTLFYEPRDFRREEVRDFMFACSEAHPEALALARELAGTPGRQLAALNNEGRELNEHRIRTFGLAGIFAVFFSSCYLGHRKPEPALYRQVLDLLQRPAQELLLIDDRPENLVPARALGIGTIHFQTLEGLRRDLAAAGVRW